LCDKKEQGGYMVIKKKHGLVEKEDSVSSPLVRPTRTTKINRQSSVGRFFGKLASQYPNIQDQLIMADMDKTPAEFMQMVISATMTYSIASTLVAAIFLGIFEYSMIWIFPIFIISLVFFFYMWKSYPIVKIKKRERLIDKDLVFAGRHMVIALRSGVPMFDSMVGMTQDYGEVSVEFNKIVERITLGEPPAQAIRGVVKYNPSKYFNRMALQIVNALNSGADLATSLDTVLDQIAKEQVISLKEYGQKLNPLSMFYMLFAIVFPSLGIVFITVLISFTGGGLTALGAGILLLGGVYIITSQFMFITMIESSRPPYELT
jgi:flagellar protein FlaJ